jgi:Ca-activated chloride channel family protein
VELDSKQDLKSIYSPSHEVEIKRHESRKAIIGYEARDVKPDTDFQLFFSSESQKDVSVNLLTYNDGADPDGGSYLLTISPKTDEPLISMKDVVFVLDTSGSMADNNKIDQAKKALQFCLKNLNVGDRFEIVRFSTEAEPLFGRLMDCTGSNREKAEAFVKELKPIGGTAIESALLKALEPVRAQGEKHRPYMIVFLTDGKPTVGTLDEDQIVSSVTKAAGDRTVRVFCFGIGTDVNTHLLDKITEKTRAASQYVLPAEDIEVKVSNFYTKISQPVLANVKLSFSGGVKVSKMVPVDLPDLFKGEQLVVFGRYAGSGDAAIMLEGAVNGESRSFTYERSFAAKAGDYTFIPRLWATRRVGYLLDQIRLNGESKELREEVVNLARQYGIVTPYTAYLVVEDERVHNVPVARRTLQGMDRDDRFKEESKRMYAEVNVAKSGSAAVGGAQAYDSLERATTLSAPVEANVLVQRGQVGTSAPGGQKVQEAIQNQQTRHIAGRTFYQNGNQWIDSNVQQRQNAKTVQVKFNSDEYFALIKKHVNAAQWLSVGRSVQLLLDDTVYEIVD